MQTQYILAGDLGATKTILATFSSEDRRHGSLETRAIKEFSSRDHSSFKEVVEKFLSKNSISEEQLEQATFGIAGPVIRGRSKLTNLDWELDESRLSKVLGIRKVKLLNDLEATANYVPFLKQNERKILHEGDRSRHPSGEEEEDDKEDRGSIAVIAPGTGLGEAFLTWDGERYHSHASEGGHADYASTSEVDDDLLRHLRGKFGHVSYELVCSGKGIYNVWSYFHESVGSPSCPTAPEVSKADDPTPVIVDAMMKKDNSCVECRRTLDTFVSALGAESGNLALKFLATGGVYLAGGLTELVLPALTDDRFARAYMNKGRMSKLVSEIPVTAMLTRNSALLGAAHYALDSLMLEEKIDLSQGDGMSVQQEA